MGKSCLDFKIFGNAEFTRQDTCANFWPSFAHLEIVMALNIILGDTVYLPCVLC